MRLTVNPPTHRPQNVRVKRSPRVPGEHRRSWARSSKAAEQVGHSQHPPDHSATFNRRRLRPTRSAPHTGTTTPRTDELGFLPAIVGSRVGQNATASKSDSRRDDRGLHSQPAYLGRTGLHDEGYPGQSPEGTGKISEAASRSSWNGAGTLRAGRGLMECRTGHSAGGSAEMPPPPDEAATTGRQTDPGPPKGSRRSAVSAMARLRLPRRSLRPGRAKCARSGPSPSATNGNNRRPSVGRRRHHGGGLQTFRSGTVDRAGPSRDMSPYSMFSGEPRFVNSLFLVSR